MNQMTSEKYLNFFLLMAFENFSILTLKAKYLKNCLSHCVVIRVLEKCCMPSAYLHWRFRSGERVVARGLLFSSLPKIAKTNHSKRFIPKKAPFFSINIPKFS